MTQYKNISRPMKIEESQLFDLNDQFYAFGIKERIKKLFQVFDPNDILVTTSFGTKSAVLLSLINEIHPGHPVYFIDTTYHFEETWQYLDILTEQLNLNLKILRPKSQENELTRAEKWWEDHPKMCCAINKIAPLDPVKAKHKVWISGLMAYQTPFRAHLRIFEKQGDIVKFHPLIDITEPEFELFFEQNQLPKHPLEAAGYGSIGCLHCTAKGQGRDGRWKGKTKTECGLHPGYFINKKKAKDAGI